MAYNKLIIICIITPEPKQGSINAVVLALVESVVLALVESNCF